MTHVEYLSWCAYVRKRGPLNVGTRIEQGIALLATLIQRARGVSSARMEDFLPKRDAGEDMATIDDLMSALKASAKAKGR